MKKHTSQAAQVAAFSMSLHISLTRLLSVKFLCDILEVDVTSLAAAESARLQAKVVLNLILRSIVVS